MTTLDDGAISQSQPFNADSSVAAMLDAAYAEFDRVTNAGGKTRVLPVMQRLRRSGPIVFGTGCRFGELEIPPVFKIDGMRSALVMDFEDVDRVLRSDEFDHAFYPEFGGETLIHLNGEKHRRYRLLLAGVFSPRAMRHWELRAVPGALDLLLDRLNGRTRVDLLAEFVRAYPATVFTELMAFPREDADRVRALGVLQGTAGIDPSLDRFVAETANYVKRFVDERFAMSSCDLADREDAISLLVRARDGETRLTREEVMSTCQLLVVGGVDTTHHALANVLFMLLTQPDILEQVRADRSLIPAAIEETMRLIPSAGIFEVRRTVKPVELAGAQLPEGMPVITCALTANRDPVRWPAPNEFRLDRKSVQHLSFASGPHQCLGMHLARMQIRCAINAILDRWPSIRLDPGAPRPEIRGFLSESPTALPVLLD